MSVPEIFASMVFDDQVMRARLPGKVYNSLKQTIEGGAPLDPNVASAVASAMRDWAVEKGATHFTHWFQPLTGTSAEKHDSFISPSPDGRVIMEFSGKELIQGEPDASSFPSGGLRATFEARGYTAWDPTSYAFIKENTLCIPTAFCSYGGEALDKKTPLLRSMDAINRQALRILRLFGKTNVKRVTTSVGPEQEYFLVDEETFKQRPDLLYTGRTLFGAKPPKGQELDDHYFGSIKPGVQAYMDDLNQELWKLGILAKTEHNEVAPAQHELAPIYTTTNIATDHNQLTMEIMRKVATRHGLVCLLHEKPFAGVNGSGKHNNWSISTDTGENLLDPGDAPNENPRFLLVLSCIMKAVDDYAALLRQSAANVGNDNRLGADEAPPAIISIFLGNQLDDLVDQICTKGSASASITGEKLVTGVSTIPVLQKDATDRNRTSPFAFTGNKFEFRMVGSSDSIANANTVLNTIVADAFAQAADELERADDFERALNELIARNMREHKRIIFNGDGYSQAWVDEAAKRGLPNLRSMVDAIPALTAPETVRLFETYGIFTRAELESRAEVMYETYTKTTAIEARTMIHMAGKHFIPAVVRFITRMADSVNKTRSACPEADTSVQQELLTSASTLLRQASDANKDLAAAVEQLSGMENGCQMAHFCHDTVVHHMARLRAAVDSLEMIVDKDLWPVPTYGDLVFEV